MLSLLLQVVGLLLLIRWADTPFLWAIMPFYGVAFGAVGALIPLLVQETFGVRYFGSILGMVNMATVAAIITGPLMVGAFFDAAGDYHMAFLTVAGIFVAGALALSLARPPRPKTATD
jgi:cyanate permease